ncbi:MAG TPA: LytR C-terminal domain-containing protein [Acidimicrobiales bacterium]|nr:LytR C-terminal domain-containing protein [Acidimicrobiales bacterium]
MTGTSDSEFADMFGPLERSGVVRGWVLVIAAVVLGALLMPSATRAAVAPAGSSASGGSGTSPTTSPSTPGSGPSTTVRSSTTTTRPTSTVATNIPPSTIHVLVANGTNTNGAAASVAAFLTGKGFPTLKPSNALTTVSATQVYPVGGAVSAATEVAQALGLSAASVEPNSMPVPVSSDAGATVVVVVGPDVLSRTSTTGA